MNTKKNIPIFENVTIYSIRKNLPSKKRKDNLKILDSYLTKVSGIIENKEMTSQQKKSALRSILRTITLNIQMDINQGVIHLEHSFNSPDLWSELLPPTVCPFCLGEVKNGFKEIGKKTITSDLSKSPIIAPIWHPEKLIDSFADIGTDVNNPFVQEDLNHFGLTYIFPMGVFWAGNGYHSINAGILKGEGQVYAENFLDISDMYLNYSIDGLFFVHKECGKPVKFFKDFRFAILYEVGRILSLNNIDLI